MARRMPDCRSIRSLIVGSGCRCRSCRSREVLRPLSGQPGVATVTSVRVTQENGGENTVVKLSVVERRPGRPPASKRSQTTEPRRERRRAMVRSSQNRGRLAVFSRLDGGCACVLEHPMDATRCCPRPIFSPAAGSPELQEVSQCQVAARDERMIGVMKNEQASTSSSPWRGVRSTGRRRRRSGRPSRTDARASWMRAGRASTGQRRRRSAAGRP